MERRGGGKVERRGVVQMMVVKDVKKDTNHVSMTEDRHFVGPTALSKATTPERGAANQLVQSNLSK